MNFKIIYFIFCLVFSNIFSEDCFFKTCVSCDTQCNGQQDFEDFVYGKTFFSVRPQDSNTVRRIINRHEINNYRACDENLFKSFIGLTFDVQRSFNNPHLAEWFLFKGKNCLTVGIPGNGQTFDIDASQLGLANNRTPQSIGQLCFNPKTENYIFDFDLNLNLDCILCGLWTRFELPVVHTKNNLGICVLKDNVTKERFAKGFFTLDCERTEIPFESILEGLDGTQGFGAVPKLDSGIFSSKSLKKTGLAGIHFDLGYDILMSDDGYLNTSLHVVFPTGTRPKGKFIFEPVIGANKSWQVGLTLNSGLRLSDCCSDTRVYLFMETVMTHLFKSKQTRLFNLNNGPLSFLLLLKEFDSQDDLAGANRAANIFTGETKIGTDFMFDGSWMLQITKCNCFFNVGYNLWARTKEKRDSTVCFRNFKEDQLGIKGNTFLSSEEDFEICAGPIDVVCATNVRTASQSTISQPAEADRNTTFIQISDIDFSSPLHPAVLTHKVFGTIGYNWNRSHYSGFIQAGAEIEFCSGNKAINQWGLIFNFSVYL